MKVNNVSNNKINQKKQSFNGLGTKVVDGMVKVQDAVLGAGVAATFVCQDFLGSEMPRVLTGLTRNSDKIGHLNYQFAAMEGCREVLTAPVMMFLPIATFALANKYIGGSIKTPVSAIESFADKMNTAYKSGASATANAETLKKAFYETSWKDALKVTCHNSYEPDKGLLNNLSDLMLKLEKADKKEAKNIIKQINEVVSGEIKQNANVKRSFSKIAYKDLFGKKSKTSIGSFIGHMSRFAKDSLKNIGEITSLPSEEFTKKMASFTKKRIGSRVIMNFATIAAALLYVTQVPKIYKSINKTNPGLIGLEEKKEDAVPEYNAPVNYAELKKLKQSKTAFKGNKPSFKGWGFNKLVNAVQTDGGFRKFVNAFEFDGINLSCAGLLSLMGLGVVYPRVKNAYDKHDKREILTRDIVTIASLVAGAKALLKSITRIFEKKSGIVMSEKAPNYAKMPTWRKIWEHLRPFGGTQVYSNEDIMLKYTNVDKYKGGFEGFCKFIKNSHGNLAKFFANDKTTAANMEQMLHKPLAQATDKEIFNAIKDAKNAKFVENIINVFKDNKNTFVKKAKSITGVFGFVSTFIAVPAFMIFLQKFNEKVTKRAIANEQKEKKITEQKYTAVKLSTDLLEPDKSKLNIKEAA